LPHKAFAPQTGQNHAIILRYFVPTFPRASAKTCYAPAAALPTIVLPAFARSLSADRKKNKKNHGNLLILKIKVQTTFHG
jgi:hypothetical protein